MSNGLSNADFARLFRKESKEESQCETMKEESHRLFVCEDEEGETITQEDTYNDDQVDHNSMMHTAMWRSQENIRTYDEEVNQNHIGLGMNPSSTIVSDSSNDTTANRATNKRVLTEGEMRQQYKWQKHTKGFGLKMFAKMGFTGRLGKDEDGVSTTIEVVQRPVQMGLGYGSFKEASALKQNKRVEKELKKEEYTEQESVTLDSIEENDDSLWRKRKFITKKQYKKASEIRTLAPTQKSSIVDMRGPEVRVLGDMAEAYKSRERVDTTPRLGEELMYNVRMVVNSAQGRVYDLSQKIEMHTETLASIRKETEILRQQVQAEELRKERICAMMEQIQRFEALVSEAENQRNVQFILEELKSLQTSFPIEFEAYKIWQMIPSLVIPPLGSLLAFSSCNLLQKDVVEEVISQFRLVQFFLLDVPELSTKGQSERVFHHVIREKVHHEGGELYNYILEETLWPVVQHMVNVQWDIKTPHGPSMCVQWFELFRPHLSDAFADAFLARLVLPRIRKECQRWNPLTDTSMMHEWVTPWILHLGSSLTSLYPDIQLTLGKALNQWHPSDTSVLPVITHWRSLWGESVYAKFTHRHIIRKLVRCLHREFKVNPQKQSLDVLKWVLQWQPNLPERQFIALLEGEFFPQWLQVLRKWIEASAATLNLAELEAWFVGWTKFFDKHGLARNPRLLIHFHGALMLLEAACNRDVDPLVPIPELNPQAARSYREALMKAKEHDNDDSNSFSQYENEEVRSSHSRHNELTLREIVENLAISNDLTFIPKGFHDGQQVYMFGKHHILMDQGIVWRETSIKGEYQPVELEELLR